MDEERREKTSAFEASCEMQCTQDGNTLFHARHHECFVCDSLTRISIYALRWTTVRHIIVRLHRDIESQCNFQVTGLKDVWNTSQKKKKEDIPCVLLVYNWYSLITVRTVTTNCEYVLRANLLFCFVNSLFVAWNYGFTDRIIHHAQLDEV